MAFSLQTAQNSASALGTTGVTVTHGFSLANGDVLYAFCTMSESSDIETWVSSSGGTWTSLGYNGTSGGNDRELQVLRRIVTNAGSEPSTYTFTNTYTTSTEIQMAIVVRVRGADVTGTPEDATTVLANGVDAVTPTATSITTASANALVLTAHVSAGAAAATYVGTVTAGAPSTWTLSANRISNGGVRPIMLEIASKEIASAGAVNPGAWTCTGVVSGDDHVLATVAIKAGAASSYTGTGDGAIARLVGAATGPILSAGAKAAATGATGVTVTHGFSLANNDVLYAFCGLGESNFESSTWASSSGGTWASVAYDGTAQGNDREIDVLRRVVTSAGSEPSTFTFTHEMTTAEAQAVVVVRVRGALASFPEDTTPTTSLPADDFTPDQAAITTLTNNTYVLIAHLAAGAGAASYSGVTAGAPSGWTLDNSQIQDGGTRPILLEVASKFVPTASVVTPGAWTCTGGNVADDNVTVSIAVRTITAAGATGTGIGNITTLTGAASGLVSIIDLHVITHTVTGEVKLTTAGEIRLSPIS